MNFISDLFTYGAQPWRLGEWYNREFIAPQEKAMRKAAAAEQLAAKQRRGEQVSKAFEKSRQARGLTSDGSLGSGRFISGMASSQTGSVLTSVTNGNQASGL